MCVCVRVCVCVCVCVYIQLQVMLCCTYNMIFIKSNIIYIKPEGQPPLTQLKILGVCTGPSLCYGVSLLSEFRILETFWVHEQWRF
jgi:hypothetical protein